MNIGHCHTRRLLVAGFVLAASPAMAHSPIEGIEGFYVGLMHPVSTAPQLLCLLALGLMAGRAWPSGYPLLAGTFGLSVLLGVASGQSGLDPELTSLPILLVAICASALAALIPRLPDIALIALGAFAGWLIGWASTPEPGPVRATVITLFGSVVGANLALLYATGAAGWLREKVTAPWMDIGQRILAAWVLAVAVLMGALVFADVPLQVTDTETIQDS